MSGQTISASALIDAPAPKLYEILADYREGHPSILPRPPFVSLDVKEGGTGAGTEILVKMRVFGRDQSFRSVVSEPDPGRVLVETNDTGYITTFTVEPDTTGKRATVTISTEAPPRDGIAAALEHWISRRLLRPTYFRELRNLAAVAGAPSPRVAA